jgi:hypothetical protein
MSNLVAGYNYRYYKYDDSNCQFQAFYSTNTIQYISNRVTALVANLRADGRPTIVPDDQILFVMDQIQTTYVPEKVPKQNQTHDMIDQVINTIVRDIKYTDAIERYNSSLDETAYLGRDLVPTSHIKLRNRRPNVGIFNTLN